MSLATRPAKVIFAGGCRVGRGARSCEVLLFSGPGPADHEPDVWSRRRANARKGLNQVSLAGELVQALDVEHDVPVR